MTEQRPFDALAHDVYQSTMSRRTLIKRSAILGISGPILAGLLAACGGDDDEPPATSGSSSGGNATATTASGGGATATTGTGATSTQSATTAPSGTTTSGSGTPKRGGTLRMATNVQGKSIDPHISLDLAGTQIKGLAYSQLLKYYYDNELVPDLAETYEAVDETTHVFQLRQGVKFHDGAELTAADVEASYARILDPETAAAAFPFLSAVESVTATDDYTVEFKLSGPTPTFYPALGMPGNYIAQKAKIEGGADFEKDVVGTGPFKFISMEIDVEAKFERNPDYFLEGLPYLDEVILRPIPDDSSRVNALYSGDVDIIPYVPWAEMASLESNPDFVLKSNKEDGFLMLDMRVDQPPFDDPRVRQAISYAIDREAIIATATSGRGKPCFGGIIPTWMFAHNADLADHFRPDPEKAKALLAEAGAENLSFEMITWPPDNELFGRPSVVVANQLKQVGINVTLVPLPNAQYAQHRREGTYQMLFDGSLYNIPDPEGLRDYYHTDGQRVAQPAHFSDAQIDAWFEEASTLLTNEERAPIYKKIEERILELVPIVWLVYREQGEGARKAVQGHEYLGSRGATNFMVETWLDE